MKKIFILAFIIIIIDQLVKFYIKQNFEYNESYWVMGQEWFQIHFTENPGAAMGTLIGGPTGKIILSILRIILIIGIGIVLTNWVKKYQSPWFWIPSALIFAGAIGNMIDGCFYGLIFDKGLSFNPDTNTYQAYYGLAKANAEGYAGFLSGAVVDMFYFPLFEFEWPLWMPLIGGEKFEFFQYIFNVADAAITIGLLILFFFKKQAFQTDRIYNYN